MFFNKKLLSHENVLRAATARSEEQGVDDETFNVDRDGGVVI